MNKPLVKGLFPRQEAIQLLNEFYQVKIRFHEEKIKLSDWEEDIKMREKRIRELQHDWQELRQQLNSGPESVSLDLRVSC